MISSTAMLRASLVAPLDQLRLVLRDARDVEGARTVRAALGADAVHRVAQDLAVGRELLEGAQAAARGHHHRLVARAELLIDEARSARVTKGRSAGSRW
jgi:hypothetical protein